MAKADYGIDAPGVVRNLIGGGAVLALLCGSARHLRFVPRGVADFLHGFVVTGLCMVATGGVMLWSSLVGKRRLARRLIAMRDWRGDETVLDVGCGRGLALIEAAKRLDRGGRATGIDLWSARDLSGNVAGQTLANARAEGVADRVAVETGDARALPYADGSFAVLVSMTVIHNLPAPTDRARAIAEMARVLAPGGTLLLYDIRHLIAHPRAVRAAGLRIRLTRHPILWVLPGILIVAEKP